MSDENFNDNSKESNKTVTSSQDGKTHDNRQLKLDSETTTNGSGECSKRKYSFKLSPSSLLFIVVITYQKSSEALRLKARRNQIPTLILDGNSKSISLPASRKPNKKKKINM